MQDDVSFPFLFWGSTIIMQDSDRKKVLHIAIFGFFSFWSRSNIIMQDDLSFPFLFWASTIIMQDGDRKKFLHIAFFDEISKNY